MKTCAYAGVAFTEPRSHPWLDVADRSDCRYHDLTEAPELIRTALEDFRPYGQHPAIEAFYALLTWLNQPESLLESNDCAFTGPEPNDNPAFDKSLECSGRVMVLFRQLQRNTAPGQLHALAAGLHRELSGLAPELAWGVVGTTLVPVRYLALPRSGRGQLGEQLMISFWAWGDTEAETLGHSLRYSTVFLAPCARFRSARPSLAAERPGARRPHSAGAASARRSLGRSEPGLPPLRPICT